MNILYYDIQGSESMPVLGWVLIGIGAILLIVSIIIMFVNPDDVSFGMLITTVACVVLGILIMRDTRIPIVKATVSDETPWKEIQQEYELIKQEGEIYTFRVKNASIEEWKLKVE